MIVKTDHAARRTVARRRTSGRGIFRIVATNPPYGAMCRNSVRDLPGTVRNRVRVSSFDGWRGIEWSDLRREQPEKTLFVSRLADIPENCESPAAGNGSQRHLVFVEEMPIEAISARVPRLHIRDARRLHIAKEKNPSDIPAMIKRLIVGSASGPGRACIVDAWVEGEDLVVLSPSFQRLRVPVSQLERYLGNDLNRIQTFEIDEDGSFLHWPHADAHLGWEHLLGIVDPISLVAAKQASAAFNQKYGDAIRRFREERGLHQTNIRGVTDRHLRRIEHGQIAATSSVLRALAEAHGISLEHYLAALAERC